MVPQAPYISPYVHLDVNFDKAVLQIRDSETGDVVRQIPSEPALESARRQLAAQARSEQLSKRLTPETSGAQAQAAVESAPQPKAEAPSAQPSNPSFGAFAKQLASLQSAISGGSTGATVSLSA
ncbi:MAG: flagellar protein FlaG [Micavibrio aeruginosavorus]|nr:flagellar protein FlaG [Micavibrio aeruginosavorus]